jgi:hypothetical protein
MDEHSSSTLYTGIGMGWSDLTSTTSFNGFNYYPSSTVATATKSGSVLTGFLFLRLTQRISQTVSIFLSGSYFAMNDLHFPATTYNLGSVSDWRTNPPTLVPVSLTLPAHSINFNYGKLGLGLGIHL